MDRGQTLGFNDVLIGNTTICEASRLVSGTTHSNRAQSHAHSWGILQLLELCALIEAVVLHDTLFALPAELSSDVGDLELRQHLLDAGILKEYPSLFLKDVISTLTRWIANNSGKVRGLRHEHIPLITTALTKAIDRNELDLHQSNLIASRLGDTWGDESVENLLSVAFVPQGENSELDLMRQLVRRLQDDDLFGERSVLNDIGGQLVESIAGTDPNMQHVILHSGTYEGTHTALRSVIYWQVSDRLHLPWYPDVLRVPVMMAWNQRLKYSLVDQVYEVVATVFDTTVNELLAEDLPYEAVIPPLGTLLLSRCTSHKQIIEELFTLREEFAPFRQAFRDLEQQRRAARSIRELRDARSRATSLLNAVSSKYKEPDQSIIETALGYAPDVLNLLSNPLDPARYKSELLKKPYEWIRDWWCRRPASRLFSVTKKLEGLDTYGRIVSQVFGFEITSKDAAFIREYSSQVRLLMTPVMLGQNASLTAHEKVEQAEEKRAEVCACGYPYRPGARFCSNCGKPRMTLKL